MAVFPADLSSNQSSNKVFSGVACMYIKNNHYPMRFNLVMLCLVALFVIIALNLAFIARKHEVKFSLHRATPIGAYKVRPDLVDRNGHLMAGDIAAPSLYINPQGIMDPGDVVAVLKQYLPDLDEVDLLRQMTIEKRQFVFIKRGIRPAKAQQIFDLGLPGVNILNERRRVYPKGIIRGACAWPC